MKYCYRCDETKPFTSFGKNKRKKDGYSTECKECKSEQDRKYREANIEKIRQQKKEAYEADRVNHKRMAWTEWVAKRKENAVGEQVIKNKHSALRRTQMRNQELSELDEFVLQEAYSLSALRSKTTGFKWSVDHIVPLFHKQACGLNNAFNVQVVPAVWNSSKSNKNMDEYWIKE